jgi:hypothetical protein
MFVKEGVSSPLGYCDPGHGYSIGSSNWNETVGLKRGVMQNTAVLE